MKTKLFTKLRLCLLAILTMGAVSTFGQDEPKVPIIKAEGETTLSATVGKAQTLKVVVTTGDATDWTYTWQQRKDDEEPSTVGDNQDTYDFIPAEPGTYTVSVQLTNGDNKSNTVEFTIEVTEAQPEAPTLAADGETTLSATVGETKTLKVVATGDTTDWTYTWQEGKDGEGPSPVGDNQDTYDFTTTEPGTYKVTVQLTKGDNKSNTVEFTIEVTEALPEKYILTPAEGIELEQTVKVAELPVELKVEIEGVEDPAGWTFVWKQTKNGGEEMPVEGESDTYKFNEEGFGNYTVTVYATKEGLETNQITFNITVIDLIVTPTTVPFGAESETKENVVSIEGNVDWEVVYELEWLTVTPNKETGKLTLAVTKNEGMGEREGTITIIGGDLKQEIVIKQGGQEPYLNVEENVAIGYDGGEKEIPVSSNIQWTASLTDGDWLRLEEPTEAVTGAGIIKFVANKNNYRHQRTATIHLQQVDGDEGSKLSKTITITQAPKPAVSPKPVDNVVITPNHTNRIYEDGETLSLEATIESEIETIEGGQWRYKWEKNSEPTDQKTAIYSEICKNKQYVDRSDDYKVTVEYVVDVDPDAVDDDDVYYRGNAFISVTIRPLAKFEVTPDSVTFEFNGGEQTVTVNSDQGWFAQSSATWLTITPNNGNRGNTVVTIKADKNESNNGRPATITFRQTGGDNKSTVVNVTQYGKAKLTVNPKNFEFEAEGGKNTISVESNIEWELSEDLPDWLKATNNGNNTITIEVDENTLAKDRTATITLLSVDNSTLKAEAVVVQKAGEVLFDIDKEQIELAASGEETGKVSINSNIAWTATTEDAWLTVTPSDGGSDDEIKTESISIKASPNDRTEHRTGTITVIGTDNVERTIEVTQSARPVKIKIAEGYAESYTVAQNDSVALAVEINDDDVDDPSDCEFTWEVEGPESYEPKNGPGKVSNSYQFANAGVYTISVYATKDGVKSEPVTFKITVLQRPPKPTSLVRKGNGSSHMMIASMNNYGDESEYKYVFGYTKDNSDHEVIKTDNRYCQYQNPADVAAYDNPNVTHWVYTTWEKNGREVRCIRTDLIKTPLSPTQVALNRGHLTAHLEEPTTAIVSIVALTGQRQEVMHYEARTVFDEQIDVSSLPPGIYVIKAVIGDEQTEEKIVIK